MHGEYGIIEVRTGREKSHIPTDEPLCSVLKSDKCTNNCPVHGPPLELMLAKRAVREGLEGGIARKEERKPGTDYKNLYKLMKQKENTPYNM